jgi:hypothetical protein
MVEWMIDLKPLESKAYFSIPHLANSRISSGDHHCTIGHAKIATEKVLTYQWYLIV